MLSTPPPPTQPDLNPAVPTRLQTSICPITRIGLTLPTLVQTFTLCPHLGASPSLSLCLSLSPSLTLSFSLSLALGHHSTFLSIASCCAMIGYQVARIGITQRPPQLPNCFHTLHLPAQSLPPLPDSSCSFCAVLLSSTVQQVRAPTVRQHQCASTEALVNRHVRIELPRVFVLVCVMVLVLVLFGAMTAAADRVDTDEPFYTSESSTGDSAMPKPHCSEDLGSFNSSVACEIAGGVCCSESDSGTPVKSPHINATLCRFHCWHMVNSEGD